MKKALLGEIITWFFILLFLYTGVAKLLEANTFRQELVSSPLLGSMAGIITWALPIGEILLAIGLFIPRWQLKALYASFGLMACFTIYVLVLLFIDGQLSCSCGGIIEDLTPRQHILFNSACVILSLVGIVVVRKQQPKVRFRWLTGISVCLFSLLGWTLFSAFSAPVSSKTGMEGRLLPDFDLLLPDSTTHFNTASIPTGASFIFVGFDPFCTHCQAETRDIIKNIQRFQNKRIYFVTSYPFWRMKAFYDHYELAKYPNILLGRDEKNVLMKSFNASFVPYTLVFDPKKRLKKAFPGEASAAILARSAAD